MIRRVMLGAVLSLLSLATVGCGRSPRVAFYTLSPVALEQEAPAGGKVVSVAVGPVTLPEMVDRPQLVRRVGPSRVEILESRRWAEPLKSELPLLVAQNLGRLLGSNRVSSYRQYAGGAADYRVLLDIVRFETEAGAGVTVEVLWSLHAAAGGEGRAGHALLREKAPGGDFDAQLAAFDRALAALSVELAAAIRTQAAATH